METKTLTLLVADIKAMTIPCCFIHYDEDSSWGCWSDPDAQGYISAYGLGVTLDDAIDDFIDALKDIASSYWDDGKAPDDVSIPFMMKVLASSKEELKSCLVGRTCDGF